MEHDSGHVADGILFRPATAEDVPAIRALVDAAYGRWVPVIGRNPTPMDADYDVAVRTHRIDLALAGADLAGLVEMIPAADHLLIENVAVAPSCQGRGLGHRLLAHAEAVARACGVNQMRLYTNARFVENIRLYRSVGYQVDREEVWTGGIVVHMSKPVPKGAGD